MRGGRAVILPLYVILAATNKISGIIHTMQKQLVFIDDSGDPSLHARSSSHFVMASAMFMDDEVASQVANKIRELRRSKGWGYKSEFKFRRTRKSVIKELLNVVRVYDFKVYAVWIDKAELQDIMPIVDRSKLYNWTIKELLARLPLDEARVRIDGRSSREYMQSTSTYLRKALNIDSRKILNVKFEDSTRSDLIQLADIIAGTIHRSLQPDKTDSKEYLSIIKPRVSAITKIKIKRN